MRRLLVQREGGPAAGPARDGYFGGGGGGGAQLKEDREKALEYAEKAIQVLRRERGGRVEGW